MAKTRGRTKSAVSKEKDNINQAENIQATDDKQPSMKQKSKTALQRKSAETGTIKSPLKETTPVGKKKKTNESKQRNSGRYG